MAETTSTALESVWDYPRPPRVEASRRHVRVVVDGTVVADSTRAMRVLERSHPPAWYIPREDVRMDLLHPTSRSSACEFKGQARYFMLGGRREGSPQPGGSTAAGWISG